MFDVVVKRTFSQRSAMSSAPIHEDKLNISLLCPLSMSRRRITLPARSIECTHIQVSRPSSCHHIEKSQDKFLMRKPHIRTTGCRLPYVITLCYYLTQANTPRLNTSQWGWYSIYIPWRDGRLSWSSWLDYALARSLAWLNVQRPNSCKNTCWMAEVLMRHVYSLFAATFVAYSRCSAVL